MKRLIILSTISGMWLSALASIAIAEPTRPAEAVCDSDASCVRLCYRCAGTDERRRSWCDEHGQDWYATLPPWFEACIADGAREYDGPAYVCDDSGCIEVKGGAR